MAGPELSVVCRSCGSEVSPYVTECPYCGQRLRKRAPKLERGEGDEIRVHESRRDKRRRERRERVAERRASIELDARPLATVATLLAGAIMIVLGQAVPLTLDEAGAIVGPVGSEYWRYVTAPFVYADIGLLHRHARSRSASSAARSSAGSGPSLTAILILATGTLGMLAAGAAESAGLFDGIVADGGNGVALGLLGAWLMLWRAEEGGRVRRAGRHDRRPRRRRRAAPAAAGRDRGRPGRGRRRRPGRDRHGRPRRQRGAPARG